MTQLSDTPITDVYSTPKRARRIPLSMPLGLTAADFDSLSPDLDMPLTPPSYPLEYDPDFDQQLIDQDWNVVDDRMLVETVLEKLRLSKREWNDCAQRLGKDKDSLGRRWKMLVGEGNIGLRRGGRRTRTKLDIRSW